MLPALDMSGHFSHAACMLGDQLYVHGGYVQIEEEDDDFSDALTWNVLDDNDDAVHLIETNLIRVFDFG